MNQNFFFFFLACTSNLLYYVQNLLATPIIGGVPDEKHRYMFHVSIHRKNSRTHHYEYFCGGSVIHESYILTAAHCFMIKEYNTIIEQMNFAQSQPKIIAGTNQRVGHGIEEKIVKVFIPSIFTFTLEKYADIAVAKLNADINFSEHYSIINYALLSRLLPYTELDREATFCGFGIYELESGPDGILHPAPILSDISRCLSVVISDKEDCSNFPSAICARSLAEAGIHTACTGDDGAGLFYNGRIAGVLSHGPPDCNSNTAPIVFTELVEFRDYVDSAMNEDDDHINMHVIGIESALDPRPSHRAGPSHSPGSSSDRSPARTSGIPKFVSKAKKAFRFKH